MYHKHIVGASFRGVCIKSLIAKVKNNELFNNMWMTNF